MTLNHTKNYKWAFKQSAIPYVSGVNIGLEVALEAGTVDLSAGVDFSAGVKSFKLDGLTVNLTEATGATAIAVASYVSAQITAAGLYDFTVAADGNTIDISSPYSFKLEEVDALAVLGWTEGIWTGSAFDEENGTTTLPDYVYNKERKYGSAGRVKNPLKSKDHKDTSFPMLIQTDTWIAAAILDQENCGSSPTIFQGIWTDGITIYSSVDSYISELKIDLAPETYPTQTITWQHADVVILDAATNIPYCTNIPPQDVDDFSCEIDDVELAEVTNVSITISPGIEDKPLATAFKRGSKSVQKKDVTVVITTMDAALSAVFASAQAKVAIGYKFELICALGTMLSTALYVDEITRAELAGEPENYTYVLTLKNGFGDVITWS